MGGYGWPVSGLPRRIKTARVYAGFTQLDLADAVEMGESTYKLTELGDRQPKRSELLAVAEACRVPMWFLDHGWDGWRRAISPEELRQIADSLPPTE